MEPLKTFGLGILWALLFPFILVGIVLVGAFGLVDFLVEFVVMIVNFFRGKKLFPVYKEDQQAYDVLQRALDKQNAKNDAASPTPAPQQVFVQQNFYSTGAPLPPGYNPAQMPPGYNPAQVPPAYNPQQVPPPQYGQIPQNQAPQYLPPQQEPVPARPELATLPPFDASQYSDKTDTIEIDIDEGGGNHD